MRRRFRNYFVLYIGGWMHKLAILVSIVTWQVLDWQHTPLAIVARVTWGGILTNNTVSMILDFLFQRYTHVTGEMPLGLDSERATGISATTWILSFLGQSAAIVAL